MSACALVAKRQRIREKKSRVEREKKAGAHLRRCKGGNLSIYERESRRERLLFFVTRSPGNIESVAARVIRKNARKLR